MKKTVYKTIMSVENSADSAVALNVTARSTFTCIVMVTVICGLVAGFCGQTANAQSTWNLTGNKNATAGSKLGATKRIPLKLITNNKTRIYIDSVTGNVGIGTGDAANTNFKLQVTGKGSGIYSSALNYGLYGDGNIGVYGNGGFYGIYGIGNTGVYGSGGIYGVSGYSVDNMGVLGSSGTGYGVQGSSGYLGVYGEGATFGLYGVSDQYGVFASSAFIGVYGSGDGYGMYGHSINGNGLRGISDNSDGAYFYSTEGYGLRAGTSNGFYAGVFDGAVYAFGGYFSSSDKNLDKNIEDFENAMSIINKLNPKSYEFSTDEKFASLNLPTGKHYGLIAQDMEAVLPDLVKETPQEITKPNDVITIGRVDGKPPAHADELKIANNKPVKKEIMNVKGVNYEGLIPVTIKAMQELSKQNEDLQKQINEMKTTATENAQNRHALSFTNASFEQNIPNPFNHNTSVNYFLPNKFSNAQIIINDEAGKVLKQINISGTGQGTINIDASTLGAGTYSYSLIIDGKKAGTKKMIIAR